ncbi:MAG: PKD domain-containing protein [Flavipsychrobacter sp.]|nr:PKD domain-containing protein [Flavipsychrobacter sp.]
MKPYTLIVVLSILLALSCKKEKQDAAPPVINTTDSTNTNDTIPELSSSTPYTITYTGNLWVKEPIAFQTDAPSTSNLSWSFGDNTGSNDVNPVKVYNKVDTFTVTLIVDGDTANALKDTLIIGCGYQRFEGNRTFYRFKTLNINSGNTVTVDTAFDGITTAAISVNNDTSFWFNGDLFEYSQSNNSFFEYTEKYWPYTTFKYFPANDSISYFGITPIDLGITQGYFYDKMRTQ